MKLLLSIFLIFIITILTSYSKNNWNISEATRYNQIDTVKKLIANGVDVNQCFGKNKYTALHSAAKNGNIRIIKLLIEADADINAKDIGGSTPFYYACSRGKKEIAEYLINKGAPFDEKNNQGRTPFFSASYNGKEETAIWLLQLGADPNIVPSNTKLAPPIFYAASKQQQKLVRALVKKGVNVNVTEDMGATPLHFVTGLGNAEIASLLIDAGADVNARNEFGWTPLYYAASAISLMFDYGDTASVIDLLVKNGADITIPDFSHQTPLDVAEATLEVAVNSNLKDKEAKKRRIERAQAALKRVKHYTKLRALQFWKKKPESSSTTNAINTQQHGSAKKDPATATSTPAHKATMPLLKIALIAIAIFIIIILCIWFIRKKSILSRK